MFVSAIAVTGSALAYVGIRTYQRKNLADSLKVTGLQQVTTTLYTQTQGKLTAATTRLLALTDAAVALPVTHRRPVRLVEQLISPWADAPVAAPGQAPALGINQTKAVDKTQWQLYGYYLYRYWRPYWKWGVAAIVLSSSFGLYLVVYSAQLKLVIDGVAVLKLGDIFTTLLTLLAALPVAFGASLFGERLTARLSSRIANDVRYDMFAQSQALPLDYYKQAKLGDLLSRFSSDMTNMENALGLHLLKLTSNGFLILAYLLAMFWLEWHLALFVLLVSPLTLYTMRYFVPDIPTANRRLRQREALALSAVQEGLRAQPIIKSFGLRQFIQNAYSTELQKLEQANAHAKYQTNSLGIYTMMFMNLLDNTSIGFGILLAALGLLPISSLVSFQILLLSLRRELNSSTFLATSIFEGVATVERIDQIFQVPTERADVENAIELRTFQEAIRLEDVAFSYTGTEYQLQQVNLTIPSGSFVAFVGPSGAGKSTLLNLLLRFYDVSAGRITIDGHDVRDVSMASLRARTAVVLQETFLFNTSILNNIRVVRPTASEAEVIEAAKAAELHNFVLTLPEGYATNVGEGGNKLSGGQKQRIAIARAMLCNPDILLLDEATSSLDADTAAAINATIQKLARHCTVIAITHALASVVHADKIYVLDQGHLVEEGNHATLMQQDGLYAQLWRTQTNGNYTPPVVTALPAAKNVERAV